MIEFELKPTFATVDSCFDLVRSHQYGIASYGVFSWSTDIHTLTEMVMNSDARVSGMNQNQREKSREKRSCNTLM